MRISKMMRVHRANSDKDQKSIAEDIGIQTKTLSGLESGKGINAQATIKIMAWLFSEEEGEQNVDQKTTSS